MSALGKLVRTTAFKLSFAYLVIFTIFAFATLAYVAWSAQRVLDQQFVSSPSSTAPAACAVSSPSWSAGPATPGLRSIS
jgi:hypothetical protein